MTVINYDLGAKTQRNVELVEEGARLSRQYIPGVLLKSHSSQCWHADVACLRYEVGRTGITFGLTVVSGCHVTRSANSLQIKTVHQTQPRELNERVVILHFVITTTYPPLPPFPPPPLKQTLSSLPPQVPEFNLANFE